MTLYLNQVKTQLQKVHHFLNQRGTLYQSLHQTHLILILIKTQRASQVRLQVLFPLPFQAQSQAQVQNQVKLQVQTLLQKVTLSAPRFLFQIQNVILIQNQFQIRFQALYLNLRASLSLYQVQIQTLSLLNLVQTPIRLVLQARFQNQVAIPQVNLQAFQHP